ncbi:MULTISPECIES: 30S ribosomal protein S21 [unclassified Tenacibaculum]|uniref:30S ribosomal protein S21 n=1 Tax=unclassified Tenacibaculum TaxID=2635139 RepID=UPI001F190FE9|nr:MULTISPECIES: 30S ribosomal protein S21 [unclassified Tenacibaculum]MCF2873386.1 30S ribosomal protein S21 [Tenacibaculum sp. Cn5-1]MCF2933542.1 30S ribosomal protein S21 [Tenacibaculum sp. Cn5-34]MCG7509876.1 30S ribosomal protein S21 [Tenacibaculum sp. Cn5-46]
MLKIIVKEGENIDRALKRYKRKFRNVKILQELRERKQFTKPSVARRAQIQKAAYREKLLKRE